MPQCLAGLSALQPEMANPAYRRGQSLNQHTQLQAQTIRGPSKQSCGGEHLVVAVQHG